MQVSRLSNQEGTSWRVMNLDLRCHGNSTALPGFNAPHTMHACAQDVCSFIQQRLQCALRTCCDGEQLLLALSPCTRVVALTLTNRGAPLLCADRILTLYSGTAWEGRWQWST